MDFDIPSPKLPSLPFDHRSFFVRQVYGNPNLVAHLEFDIHLRSARSSLADPDP